ncbi:MAG: carboxypeptidase-like regulatory domain-containing protein [Eubacteriales bacterium]
MKKITTLLLSLLLLCGMSMTAFAEDVDISTTVPESHHITVVADGAEVFCGGGSGGSFTVGRLAAPTTVLIRADSGKTVKQVLLNGEDITSQIKGGYYTLAPVYEDKTLTVITEEAPSVPQGKAYTIKGTVLRDGQPVPGITFELRSTLKTTVTDQDGLFSFDSVAYSKYSLTALENGKIVGYIEFLFCEGDSVDFRLADNGVYKVTADQEKIGITLTLNLTDQNTMKIESISEIKELLIHHPWLWVFLALVICTVVSGVVLYVKKEGRKTVRQKDNDIIPFM